MAKNNMGRKTKGKILESACCLFNERGFDNVSVEEIASNASITKAMVYYHFESKEAIMLDLVKHVLEIIKAEINRVAAGTADQEMLSFHIGKMTSLWKENKEIGLFIITKGIKDPQIFSDLLEMVKSLYDRLVSTYQGNSEPDKAISEQYARLFLFNTMPMISYAVLSDHLAAELMLTDERLNEIFKEQFISILNKFLKKQDA